VKTRLVLGSVVVTALACGDDTTSSDERLRSRLAITHGPEPLRHLLRLRRRLPAALLRHTGRHARRQDVVYRPRRLGFLLLTPAPAYPASSSPTGSLPV
jgi:hypothetical protein